MSKTATSDQNHVSHFRTHGSLRALIEALHDMVIAVSERLRHAHIRDRRQMEHAKGSYDIWKRLGSHMESVQVDEEPVEESRSFKRKESAKRPVQPAKTFAAGGRFSALGDYFTRKSITEQHPHLDEKLRSRTMEHISIALHLARKGKQDGVKVHIGLAESAMHTASRFMSRDDYEAFEQQVERRLESIIEGSLYAPGKTAA
jgi:hypothetical protein